MDPSAIAAAGRLPVPRDVEFTGRDPYLPTAFPVGEIAAVSLGLVARSASDYAGIDQSIRIDSGRAAASLLSCAQLRLVGRDGPPWSLHSNPVTSMYQCGDGRWIHLHGGFPGLERGTLDVLGCAGDARSIAEAVAQRSSWDLEEDLAAHAMCGAVVRASEEWAAHEQGRAVAALAAVEVERIGDGPPQPRLQADRPLGGVRVLDLTRVLAGPACARTLAEHGADVLHISSPTVPSREAMAIDTGHGKRAAFLDLDRPEDVDRLRGLVTQADVFSQGYRLGALARRGFGPEELASRAPGIIYVTINCYSTRGPWAGRPGWEQMAQSVSGIAVQQGSPGAPTLLPAAANDYTTGYLAAYGVIEALRRRAEEGGSWHVHASLCQTASWIVRVGPRCDRARAVGAPESLREERDTVWGRLSYLAPVPEMPVTPPRYEREVVPLGTHAAEW